ncbi:MAG: helix-turn-helix domain-containing protein [Pseudomonadota bacterium]
MKDVEISEVAKRANVPASTLRYYEERGLISSTGRRGQRRLFDPSVFDTLSVIALGRAAGFSLDEISVMFKPDGKVDIKRQMLTDKADELERTIEALQTMVKGLRHAAACSAPSHMECPTFRRLLSAASAGTISSPIKLLKNHRS